MSSPQNGSACFPITSRGWPRMYNSSWRPATPLSSLVMCETTVMPGQTWRKASGMLRKPTNREPRTTLPTWSLAGPGRGYVTSPGKATPAAWPEAVPWRRSSSTCSSATLRWKEQGWTLILSSFLYSLYTHDCLPSHNTNTIDKFADDITAVLFTVLNL